jgi:hypothetical protein
VLKHRLRGMGLGGYAGSFVFLGLECWCGEGAAYFGANASTCGSEFGRCLDALFVLATQQDVASTDLQRLLRGSFLRCLGNCFSDLQLFDMIGVDNQSLMTNRRYPAPLVTSRESGRTNHAPPLLSAAVAYLCRSAESSSPEHIDKSSQSA